MRHHHDYDDEPRGYRRESPYGPDDFDRESYRRGREERGLMERAGDQVRSWFGDEDAERRRRRDQRDEDRGGRDRAGEAERDLDDRMWARQWGYVEARRDPRYAERSSWRDRGPSRLDDPWGDRSRDEGSSHASAPWYRGSATPGRTGNERWQEGAPGGRHFGKGPRTYQRSDERIRDEVCERLACSGEIDATDVDVQVRSGEVTLLGRVGTRFEKRMAEDLAESVWGAREIQNQLRVGGAGQETGAPREPDQGGWQPRVA